jgi:hypothetical protein
MSWHLQALVLANSAPKLVTEALDLTTPAGRAIAGLLAIFSEFEREVLRERTRAGLAHVRVNRPSRSCQCLPLPHRSVRQASRLTTSWALAIPVW